MSAQWMADLEVTDMEEEDLWEMIERHRWRIVQKLSPERLTPYLRQSKVIDAMDEEEVLHCAKFSTRAMRLGHLLDILRTRGKNGAIAFLDSLILANQGVYTLITGKEPSTDPNSFSKLIDNGQLSVLLMNALSNVQDELMQEKQVKKTLAHHLRKMRDKMQKLEEEGECVRSMEYENQRLRRELDAQSQMLSKLKDEQYELSMRYSHALQEKDTMQSRNSELQEQVFALKEDLHRVRTELQVLQSRSHHGPCEEELRALRKENSKLKERLEVLGEPQLAELDIKPCQDGQTTSPQQMLAQLCAAEKNRAAEEELELTWQKEKASMMQESRHLQSNYDILKKKMETLHSQLSELQKERDQAYRSRDMVQAEISCSLGEKDSLRKQVMDLTEQNSELTHHMQALQAQLHSNAMGKELAQFKHQRLVRMDAIGPSEDKGRSCSTSEEFSFQVSSDFGDGSMSSYSFHDDYLSGLPNSRELPDILQDERCDLGLQICSHGEINERSHQLSPASPLCNGESLPCSPVRRRHARKMTSRVTMIAFQGDDLLKQISIIGGNKTGIFVHHLTPGSAADEMSLMPGYKIMAVDFDVINPAYKVNLGGMTCEDAHSTLHRVNGFCCLSVQCNMEDYRRLLNDIHSGVVTSGDSFYVRVNQSISPRVEGGLKVTCGEILHITDTMYKQRCQWFARRVNAYTLKDGDAGIIPNYRQAQQQLITSIQSITWQNGMPPKQQKEVRIVSTDRCSSHLLWMSQDCGICCCAEPATSYPTGRGCLTLMPYTLVTHYKTSVLRPVLLVPSLLRRILSEKLCANKDFMKCDTECLSDAEYAARNQRGDIIGEKEGDGSRCWYTRQNVESVAQQNAHCLLELSLSCLSALIRVGIYPIILHIPLTEKSTKKLKKTRQWWGKCEELLVECAQREEAELDALPCLYRTVDPDSWNDPESLLCRVRSAIIDEQKRLVWLDNQPC